MNSLGLTIWKHKLFNPSVRGLPHQQAFTIHPVKRKNQKNQKRRQPARKGEG